MSPTEDELRMEFNKSSMNEVPDGIKPAAFQIRNDYPTVLLPVTDSEVPWLEINFEDEPKRYLEAVKDYCLLGMPESDFNVQENKVPLLLDQRSQLSADTPLRRGTGITPHGCTSHPMAASLYTV